ncbi:MAG: universal stress protein [Mogibacterium sp.]|nr:universal stress protein [Mogibacterium sp.]
MKKILIPIEETQRSLKALTYVKKHYTPEEAEFVLMMIDERLSYSVRSEVESAVVKELNEKLDLIAESLEGYKLTKLAAIGKPGVRITRAVRDTGADLIVMTKSSKEDMLNSIGSTAEYVINNAPCDVIIVSEQVNSRNAYRGLIYRTAKGTVNLRGQLGDKQSECLLPSVNQDCIYHINVTVGKIRFFHTAYNPDTRNWDLPPVPGQDVTLDIAAGEARDILVKADSTDGKADRIRIVNRDMRKEAVFDFRITAAPENHEPAPSAEKEKTPFEKRATLEVPRTAIPKDFEAPEVPTFIAEAKAEFDALEKEIADAAASAETPKATTVYETSSFAEYLKEETKNEKKSGSLFSVEIKD